MANSFKAVVLSRGANLAALDTILRDSVVEFSYCTSISELKTKLDFPLIVILYEPQELSDFHSNLKSLRADFPYTAFIMIQQDYDETLAKAYIEVTSGHYLLHHQMPLLPSMLNHIIKWQNQVEDRNSKIRKQQAALVSLTTSPTLNSGAWGDALCEICAVTAKTLQVSRVSIWLFDSLRDKLVCQMLYKLDEDDFENGFELSSSDYSHYFAALHQNRVISASNAQEHSVTSAFSLSYLSPLKIKSMLDAPIRVGGGVRGTVCFEQQDELRHWTIDDEVFAGAAADLTALLIESLEHRRIEEAVRQTEKLQSLGLLASGIAHDFNNLLTVILSQSSLMADALEKEHPAYKSLIHIVNTTRQASALTKQLLTYAGNKPVQITGLALKSFMEEHQNFLRLAIPSHIELSISDPEALAIEVDEIQLQQVLLNLVINAAEAMNERGNLQIGFAAESLNDSFAKPHCYRSESFKAGDYVRVTVSDTGQGIEEADIKRVFEPFFSTKSNGRGLGLATVLGVIRSHGGAMCVESSVGNGTSFHLYFKQATVETINKVVTSSIPALMQHTVLVVDDAPEIVESISEILEINGLSTLTAYTGTEAVNLYREDSQLIDLILVDMSMPGMNGAETFEKLRQIRADAKVIILSGYHDKDLLRYFTKDRPDAFLAKPYDVNSLLETVWRYLA